MRHSIRADQEERERFLKKNGLVSPNFTLSCESRGRLKPEEDDGDWRTIFQRDYDRIVWANAYMRLRNKSQTTLQPINQEITTRLTHTILVTQLAVRNCQFVSLNSDLGGAIGAGHDLGHTPFGHAGEKALTEIVREILGDPCYVFHHAKYGLDIVDRVENDGKGLNLSLEVRDGILNHSRGGGSIDGAACRPFTPEGEIAMWADKFAYTSSDIRDMLKLGIITEGDLPRAEMAVLGCVDGYDKSRMLDELNYGLVMSTLDEGNVSFTGDRRDAFNVIRGWMYKNVYGRDKLNVEFKKAQAIMKQVFKHVLETEFDGFSDEEAVNNTIDVVACMTDESIIRYYDDNFKPSRLY